MMTVQGNKKNQNAATSAKAIRIISTEWSLICAIVSIGHLMYLLYAVLAEQESETRIRLEALFVLMEAWILHLRQENILLKAKTSASK